MQEDCVIVRLNSISMNLFTVSLWSETKHHLDVIKMLKMEVK